MIEVLVGLVAAAGLGGTGYGMSRWRVVAKTVNATWTSGANAGRSFKGTKLYVKRGFTSVPLPPNGDHGKFCVPIGSDTYVEDMTKYRAMANKIVKDLRTTKKMLGR